MNNQLKILAALAIGTTASTSSYAKSVSGKDTGDGQPAYEDNQIQAHLRVDVDKSTKEVKVIRKNNDPEVFTKVYPLKYADPFEVRPYIRESVTSSKSAHSSDTRVECIKYADGTGALIVSAEDYRFANANNGMTMDDLVASFDKPKLTSSSGQKHYMYFPKYWSASTIANTLKRVGMNGSGDTYELMNGNEGVGVDAELNGLLLYINPYNLKNVDEMLKQYDQPLPEVNVKYTVYEVDMENDAKLGADFQAWKNGDGSRALSVGHRAHDQWNSVYSGGVSHNNNGRTSMIGFSPKWNTRYLDFLRAKGHAKVVTTGQLAVANNQTASINAANQLQYFKDGEKIADGKFENAYMLIDDKSILERKPSGGASYAERKELFDAYWFEMTNSDGQPITVYNNDGDYTDRTKANTAKYNILVQKVAYEDVTKYRLTMQGSSVADAQFMNYNTREMLGREIEVESFKFMGCDRVGTNLSDAGQTSVDTATDTTDAEMTYDYAYVDKTKFNSQFDMTLYRDNARTNGYATEKFAMTLKPTIASDATVLDVKLTNDTTVVGFKDNGAPRINATSYATTVQVPNNGGEFAIGGLEKTTVERGVTKVPLLGDIPLLGWAFTTESEATRKYQMITVLEVTPANPGDNVKGDLMNEIDAHRESIQNPGEENFNYGFDQWGLDKNKDTIDSIR